MITLIVPTMNRSDFLIRLLRYYRDLGFKGCIAISDSSNADHIERTRKEIEALKGSLDIIYREYHQIGDVRGQQQLIDLVTTPYVAIMPDDDFIVPAALEECRLFLESHPDYSAVHGIGMALSLQASGPYGQVSFVRPYERSVIESESASQRILDHLKNYTTTLFSVHRIESWRVMYRDVHLLNDDKTFSWELLPCCLSVILGKVKELDCLYLMRQEHPQRYILPGKYAWVRNPNWPKLYQVFIDLLAREVAAKDGITGEAAKEIVEQAFGLYMTQLLGRDWRNHSGLPNPGVYNNLRKFISRIPGVLQVWGALYSSKSKGREETSLLAELLNPSSLYHSDFMPIYRAVTAGDGVQPD